MKGAGTDMPFVVDTSIVGSWVLPDENHPEALAAFERLKDDEAFAPSFLRFELRNLLLANKHRQRIAPAQTAAALNLVRELPLHLDGQDDSDTTLQLAREHRLTIYDAAYLELAVRRHLPLVTFDAALAEAARSEKR
jgi:predicted nucleic acid-binding protein